MFGVLTTFKFSEPLTSEEIGEIRRQAIEPMSEEPGFRHYFAIQGPHGEVGSFHVWDSKAQAERAIERMMPLLQPLIQDKLIEPPQRIMSEIVAEL